MNINLLKNLIPNSLEYYDKKKIAYKKYFSNNYKINFSSDNNISFYNIKNKKVELVGETDEIGYFYSFPRL